MSQVERKDDRLFGAFSQFGVLAYKSPVLGHFRSIHQVAVFGL